VTDVFVTGVGMTHFAKLEGASEAALVQEAVALAIEDAAVEPESIDAVFLGNVFGAGGLGQIVMAASPLAGKPITNVENACASSSSAMLEGIAWIKAGFARRVLVIGVEVLTGRFGGLLPIAAADPYSRQGMTLPALYALKARDHMEKYGTTPEQFAAVAVKNRRHGTLNPNARFQTTTTVEEVLASRLIADPITMLQCCPNSDGAAAAVLVAEDLVTDSRAVRVAGSALGSGKRRAEIGWDEATLRDTARQAYGRAGVTAADVNLAEVHDAFAPGELFAYERLGFSEPGKGGPDVESGRFTLGGSGPTVNSSGGLIARGHPLGATGIAQVHEIVTQLRGEAGDRQVAGAQVGVAVTMGGSVPQLETNACAVHVLTTR
jgi:acetyl-CoA acetyltransferase